MNGKPADGDPCPMGECSRHYQGCSRHLDPGGRLYFRTAANLPAELAATRQLARAARLATNRGLSCERCQSEQVVGAGSEIPL